MSLHSQSLRMVALMRIYKGGGEDCSSEILFFRNKNQDDGSVVKKAILTATVMQYWRIVVDYSYDLNKKHKVFSCKNKTNLSIMRIYSSLFCKFAS